MGSCCEKCKNDDNKIVPRPINQIDQTSQTEISEILKIKNMRVINNADNDSDTDANIKRREFNNWLKKNANYKYPPQIIRRRNIRLATI
jgi:hypothetical protein